MTTQSQAAEAASRHQVLLGVLSGFGAYISWTLTVILYKNLVHVSVWEVVAHRSLWSFVFVAFIVAIMGRWGNVLGLMRNPKMLISLFLTGLLIGLGWVVLVWLISQSRIMEASIGQFMLPLASVLTGIIFLRERPSKAQLAALLLAAAALVYFSIRLGFVPWLALFMPGSFVIYTYVRKLMQVDAVDGLFIEMGSLLPFAIMYFIWLHHHDALMVSGHGAATLGLLFFTGPATVLPLLMFLHSAKRVSMTTLGFMQYMIPSGSFLLAVLVYDEALTRDHIVTFSLIWTGLIIFTMDAWRRERELRRMVVEPVGQS